MTKISNQRVYIPDEEINGLDYLPGTDFDQALKTVNFRVQDLGTHYNQVNGVRNFDYNFYAHSGSNPKPADGYFYSNSNEQDPNNITYFVFSKKTARFKDTTNFFESISTENPFDLIIAQKVDINTIFFFRIDSIETFSGYYKLNVSEVFFPNGKELSYTLSYAVFNLKSEGGPTVTKTSDLLNDGSDGTSTYVETDELGATAFSNDYNDLDNKPTIPTVITNHSGLSLDDGTNPHGTTKQDVGLGDVPNLDTTNAVNNEHTHSNKTILDNTTESFITVLKNAYDGAVSWITTNGTNLINHLSNTSNPHNVTKSQVGLGSVDNTSDADKPISTATQNALNSKLDKVSTAGVERAYIVNADGSQGTKSTSDFKDVLEFADFDAFPTTGETGIIYVALDTNFTYRWSGSAYVQIGGGETTSSIQTKRPLKTVNGESLEGSGNVQIDYNDLDNKPTIPTIITNHSGLALDDGTNPHGTTKDDVELGNVDNTSDANKPISNATQVALDNKQDELVSGTNIKTINGTTILGSGDIVISSGIDLSLFPKKYEYISTSSGFQNIGVYSALTVTGTQSNTSTNGGAIPLRKILSAATAGSSAIAHQSAIFFIANNQAFYFDQRIDELDSGTVSNSRCSYGLGGSANFGNYEPSSYLQGLCSLGHESTDANFQILYKISGAVTLYKIDLGVNFPKNSSHKYHIVFYRLPNDSTMNYYVKNISTGFETSGTFTYIGIIPSLTPNNYRNNNTTATSVGFGINIIKTLVSDEYV